MYFTKKQKPLIQKIQIVYFVFGRDRSSERDTEYCTQGDDGTAAGGGGGGGGGGGWGAGVALTSRGTTFFRVENVKYIPLVLSRQLPTKQIEQIGNFVSQLKLLWVLVFCCFFVFCK